MQSSTLKNSSMLASLSVHRPAMAEFHSQPFMLTYPELINA